MSAGLRVIVIGLLVCCAAPAAALDAAIEVRVEGVGGALRENILATLSVTRYRGLPDLTEATVQRLHARAGDEIRAALQPYGYYEPAIDAELAWRRDHWLASYRVQPGEPVRIGDVDITVDGAGSDDPAFTPPAGVPLRGDRLLHPQYEALKQHFLTTAANRGYLDARFTRAALRVSVAERRADIVLHFDTGGRYHFGEITLQQDILDADFVQRFVTFEAGDPYSVSDLLSLQYALTDSEYFSLVSVEARREHAVGNRVPVTVTMEPRPRHRYSAGVGYATDTGPRLLAGWENRRVNARGHRLAADLELSAVRQLFSTRYVIPLDNPVWERLTLAANVFEEELGDVESSRAELVVAHTERNGRWQQTLSTRMSRERDLLVGGEALYVTQLVPMGEWLYTGGDSGVRARDGYRLNFDLAASDPFVGAPTRFLQLRTRVRSMHPVGDRDRLLLRLEVGTTFTGEPELLPSSQRFFAGGDNSVRGYRYNELGTRDAAGNVVGGRHLLTASVEYEHWFTERWGAALFADAGNAFAEFGDGLKRSVGIGARWGLPFAVVAVDVAHPLDDPEANTLRLHLTLSVDL